MNDLKGQRFQQIVGLDNQAAQGVGTGQDVTNPGGFFNQRPGFFRVLGNKKKSSFFEFTPEFLDQFRADILAIHCYLGDQQGNIQLTLDDLAGLRQAPGGQDSIGNKRPERLGGQQNFFLISNQIYLPSAALRRTSALNGRPSPKTVFFQFSM